MTAALRAVLARAGARLEASNRALWFAVLVPLLVVYVYTLRTNIFDLSADPVGVTPSAWGVAHHATPIVSRSQWPSWNPWAVAVGHDRVVTNRTPGLVYLAAPFYWLFPAADPFTVLPASLAAALATAAAMATLAVAVRRFGTARFAWATGLIAGTATTSWAVAGTALWPHGPDQLLLALALLSAGAGASARTGLAFAAAMLIRPTLGIVAACSGVGASWSRRSLRPVLVVAAISGVGAVAFLTYARHYWGVTAQGAPTAQHQYVDLATHGYGTTVPQFRGGVLHDYAVKLAGALVSPGRGVLVGSPFLLALLPGLRRGWRAAPAWARSASLGGVLYLLVQLKSEVFTGGQDFWSYRYPLETLTVCAPLLVLAWREWTARRAARRTVFWVLVVVSVTWQAVGAICFRGPYLDRPWTFANLDGALTRGPHDTLAVALLALGGVLAAGVAVHGLAARARRPAGSGSAGAHVGDVAGADGQPRPVDVDR